MKRNLRLASAVGPATHDQLEQWADEHDRTWDRTVCLGIVLFGLGLVGLGGVAVTEAFHAFKDAHSVRGIGNPSAFGISLGLVGALACVLAVLWVWWHCVVRRNFRPVNPYRPIETTTHELERANAAYPGALAYLDAIRHQRRAIVQHDLDVLEMIRRQQQFDQGGQR